MSVLTNIANETGRIQNAKSGIANAINSKGVTVPSTAKLGDYPGFINLISGSGGSGSSVPQGKVIGGFSNSSLNDVFNGETTLVYADLSAAEGVSNMAYTFSGCTNLVNVPIIPNSVTNMAYTFNGCASLVNAPIIPNSVTSMYYTFGGCVNLANAPAIPNSVTNMSNADAPNTATHGGGSNIRSGGGNHLLILFFCEEACL